jgi:hypothetical protein
MIELILAAVGVFIVLNLIAMAGEWLMRGIDRLSDVFNFRRAVIGGALLGFIYLAGSALPFVKKMGSPVVSHQEIVGCIENRTKEAGWNPLERSWLYLYNAKSAGRYVARFSL